MLALTVIEKIKTFVIFFINHFPFFNCFLLIKADKYIAHYWLFDHFEPAVSIILIFSTLLLLSFNYNVADDNRFVAHFMINAVTVLNTCVNMIDKDYAVKLFNAPAF